MPLLLRNSFSLAHKSIRHHRVRSFLTCLGIAIGIASITLILSLIGSINSLLDSHVSKTSSSLLIVRPRNSIETVDQVIGELTRSTSTISSSLTLADLKTIKSEPNISAAAPISLLGATLTSGDYETKYTPILATNQDFKTIENLSLASGTFLSDSSPKNTIILGKTLASTLFSNAEPVGRTISILGEKFIILGVLSETNNPINYNNIDLDKSAIVDIDFLSSLNTSIQISQINTLVAETSSLEETKSKISSSLEASKSDSKNFEILSGNEITNPSSSLLTIVSSILGIIAAISLVIGGIGVTNIMLVTITERTHEIGIKKATGASNFNILSEFLIESALISLTGGVFGIIIGYLIAGLISMFTPFPIYISWEIILVTLTTALLTGVIFGLIPSDRAARKDPIRSLKTYY